MPGINQLPAGSEGAAAVSLIWASTSWICSSLLLWLTWSHHEGWSYLSLLAVSSISSTTFSIVQQIRDITFYVDIVTEGFERKMRLPADDPELAIANGSFGVDLVLYYLQYYLYSVQAMLVMFWAAELCQLTYQVGERRTIRVMFRKLHTAGKLISWLLPLMTILMLRIPSLKESFLAFILIADLPLMISLAIGSGLMIAVLIRYVRTRQKFTQWAPPDWNSGSTSQGGTVATGSQDSSHRNLSGRRGLYDRWLMVRFTIAFVSLAIFECTNTLFQFTALQNNIKDSKATAPDLSAGRAIQTMILFMPGTTPGLFIFVVFGTTASSRKKLTNLLIPKSWRESSRRCFGRSKSRSTTPDPLSSGDGGITVKRSLTVTSTSRLRAAQAHDDDYSEPSIISMDDLTRRSESTRSVQISYMKPLPLTPGSPPTSRFNTPTKDASSRGGTTSNVRELMSIEEKDSVVGGALTRTNTDDSLRVPGMQVLGTEHSDDSGPILPIQGHEVRLSRDMFTTNGEGSRSISTMMMWSVRSWLGASCLFPGTVLGANLLVSHFSGSIYSLSLTTNNGTGQLAITSTLRAGGRTPSWLTLDSATGNLYVTDEAEYGAPVLTTLKVNNDNSVQLVGTAPTSGGGVHSELYGGNDGRGFFAVAEYNPSTITTYKLPLSASSQQIQKLAFNMSAPGPDPYRQDKPHPHSVFTDPTGRFLLSPDLGADLIRIFSIDASTGQLTNCPAAATGAGDGPRHGEFWTSPSGSLFLYIVNELAGSVTAWTVTTPPAGGGCLSLSKIQSASTYPAGKTPPAGSKSAEVRVSGDFVYATNRNDQSFGTQQDSAATFAIDAASGKLSFVEATNTHSYFPRTFVVNKAGDAVAFGGQTSSTVVVVARDVATGRLGDVVAQLQVGAPGTVNNEDGLSAVVWDD